jgi:hypothetical protein
MTFCKDCNANVEWHKTAAGRDMPIDPLPMSLSPEAARNVRGLYYFDGRLRLVSVLQLKPSDPTPKRVYSSHFDTCTKRRPAPAFVCDRRGCDVKERHRHCYRCGSVDHLADDCQED